MYINRDYTQIAARHDKELYLYKNKKTTILTFDDDKSKITEIITPVNTQKQTISQKNNGNVKGTVTHIALDSFEEKFLRSTANKIYIVHKNNIVDTVVEKAHEYVLSKDGKQLYYKGEYENIICYSNGKNKDYFNGHAGVKKIYAYDYVNKGLYFSLEDENFCYSNGKNTTLVSEQEPAFTLFCNDGYLYYFDDSNLYAADKGKSRIVMEEVPDFEKIIDKYNTRSEHGVFYQADNGSAYFINKGTAKQIVISD